MLEERRIHADVPFLDLRRLHAPLKDEILREIGRLIDRSEFVTGPTVERFEAEFAAASARALCVGTASGLDAIRLTLSAAGVGPGDEVIVPAHTFVATFEAVSQVGATPVPVDVTTADYNIDVAAVTAVVGQRTRAVVPVHLYGQLADMAKLRPLAAQCGLRVIEDAAQAHGARRDGARPGDGTAAAAYSFYVGKNLGAIGDAGAVVTDDPVLARGVRSLREHGQSRKYVHDAIGWTSRLDAVQAAVLWVKLRHLDRWNEERRRLASLYGEVLEGVGDLALPPVPAGSDPAWHLYVVRTADPAALADHLQRHGVQTGRHYPAPPHLSRAYEHLGYSPGAFPVAECLARELLSLPIFPGMTNSEVDTVARAIRTYFAGG